MITVTAGCWANNVRGSRDTFGVVIACNKAMDDVYPEVGLCPHHISEIVLFPPEDIAGLIAPGVGL